MKKAISTSFLFFMVFVIFGQEPSKLSTFYSIGRLNATGSFGGLGTVVTASPNAIEGDEFYDDPEFKLGFISVSGFEKPFGEFLMRYNIRSRELEIQDKEKIISLSLDRVKSFMYENSQKEKHFFFNGKGYKLGDKFLDGFFEVLIEGSHLLIKRKTFEYKKMNFNPLDVENSTSEKLLKKEEFFLLKEGSIDLIKLPVKQKILFSILGKSLEISDFVKKNNIGVKSERELRLIIAYANSLK